jgi:hypothetical protein
VPRGNAPAGEPQWARVQRGRQRLGRHRGRSSSFRAFRRCAPTHRRHGLA